MSEIHGTRTTTLDRLIEIPAVIAIFLMMLHVTANALLRSFLSTPLPGTLETVQYWYVPVVALLGFIAAQRRNQHISADLVFAMLPMWSRRWVLAASSVACAITCAGFAFFGFEEALHAFEIGLAGGLSDIAIWPVLFLVPLTFGTLTVQFGISAVRSTVDPHSAEHLAPPTEDISDMAPEDQALLDSKRSDSR